MHYEHVVDAALSTASEAVKRRLSVDMASRAMLYSPQLDAHTADRELLDSVLKQVRDHHRYGTPNADALRVAVDVIWSDIDGLISRKMGTIATAVGWAASLWESADEALDEVRSETRAIADQRAISAELRRRYRWFTSDNEELWWARRASWAIEAELEGELWSFAEDDAPENARLSFDPIALLEAIGRGERGETLAADLDAVADEGWFARLHVGLAVIAMGSHDLPTNVAYQLSPSFVIV